MKLVLRMIALALVTSIGCGGGSILGDSTGAQCLPDTNLTYTNFARNFMEKYCTECHSSELVGDDARQGAPLDHDLDTLPNIRGIAEHVDQVAGSGPNATNDSMPPDGEPQPTLAEREQLAIWIACQTPQ